jgi:hypothetical protein
MRNLLIAGAAAVAMLGTTAVVAQENSGKRFTVTLEGDQEVPNMGDPDGTGRATIRINPGQGQLCYTLRVAGIDPATAAHVHEAPAGVAGPPIVHLTPPTNGTSQGCVPIGKEQAMEILRDPEEYYVNVHNAEFPSGALRGQLGM